MTIEELYNKLCDEEFQDPHASTYNYYMYQYPAKDEYYWEKEIRNFVENLKRPANIRRLMRLFVLFWQLSVL